jgi:hypothetical protein
MLLAASQFQEAESPCQPGAGDIASLISPLAGTEQIIHIWVAATDNGLMPNSPGFQCQEVSFAFGRQV